MNLVRNSILCHALSRGLAGYREASTTARAQLEAVSFDHKADEAAFRQDLLNIARTTLSSKILTQVRPSHCQLCCVAFHLSSTRLVGNEDVCYSRRNRAPWASDEVRRMVGSAWPLVALTATKCCLWRQASFSSTVRERPAFGRKECQLVRENSQNIAIDVCRRRISSLSWRWMRCCG